MNKKTAIVRTVSAALLSALICLASCQSPFEPEETVLPGETVTEVLELEFGDPAAFTKVGIASATGQFSWTDGDQVAVWYQNGTSGAWSSASISANSLTVSGTGTRAKLAVYPYGARTDFNLVQTDDQAHPVTKIHYSNQIDLTGKDKDYAPVPMIALNDPTRNGLKFYHVGGLIRFRLHGIPAGTHYIRISSDAAPLCGDFPVAIPTGNEINAAELVYSKGRWCTLYDENSWDSLFGSTHGQSVLVKITNGTLAAETDNITINLPVPMGVYNQLTVTAVGADGTTPVGGSAYETRNKAVVWECDRATATHLQNLALKANHPMVNPNYVPGKFSVAGPSAQYPNGKQVWFAHGNLYVDATTSPRTWAFEQNQYNIPGSSTCSTDFFQIFGWGSGGTPTYQTGDQSVFIDWGRHFDDVGNGSDGLTNGTWYTLSADEWNYLIMEREDWALLRATGSIYDPVTRNFINGLIICPDNWETPASCNFLPMVTDWSGNVYTAGDTDMRDGFWKDMEEAGAVFLPAAGEGFQGDNFALNRQGTYWSTDGPNIYGYSTALAFTAGEVEPRRDGFTAASAAGASVRLVHD